jgi:hypothetical protein
LKVKTRAVTILVAAFLNERFMKGRIITMLIALSMLGVILGLQLVHV